MTDRFMRDAEVAKVTGLCRTTRWELERDGKFPRRRLITSGSVGWLESEIDEFVRTRPAGAPPAKPAALAAAACARKAKRAGGRRRRRVARAAA
jgi:prophage regulatory protein